MAEETALWIGKPFNYGFPSFTQYQITDRRLIVEKGLFTKKREETLLFRIRDISLKRSLTERIWNMGDITIQATDSSTPIYILKNIKNSIHVADLLGEAVEKSRIRNKVMELTEVQT